jgi:hypothetical protein
MRWAGLFLAFVLPPLVTGESQNIVFPILGAVGSWLPQSRRAPHSYLVLVGPPPLRFLEAHVAPPRNIVVNPPPAPPSSLGRIPGQSSILDVLLAPGWHPSATSAAKPARNSRPAAQPSAEAQPATPPILPDDGGTGVHPEDFLPFFQFPGAAGPGATDASVALPSTPGRLPPSTASYHQE